ncbi:MAG: tetratricopeptide repeat protein [Bacteroidota bacterium]
MNIGRLTIIICATMLCIFFYAQAHSQDQQITDSLSTIIKSETIDTIKIQAVLSLVRELHRTDPDSALILCRYALKLSEDILISEPSNIAALNFKTDALKKLGYIYQRFGQLDTSLKYLEKALPLAQQLDNQSLAIQCIVNIGINYDYKGDFETAVKYYREALEKSIAISDTGLISSCYGNLAAVYEIQGQPIKSLEYHKLSLKLAEQVGDVDGVASSLNSIGGQYYELGDVPSAIEYLSRALKISEEIQDKESEAMYLNNIGVIYHEQGDSSEAINCFKKAFEVNKLIGNARGIASGYSYMALVYGDVGDNAKEKKFTLMALKLYEEIGDKRSIAKTLFNLGSFYSINKDSLDVALSYLRRSLSIREEIGDPDGLTITLDGIAHCYFSQGKTDSAAIFAERSREIAVQLGYVENISRATKIHYAILKAQGKYSEALEAYELHIQMRDSIKNEETQKATIRQQTKYEFEKAQLVKEQEQKEADRVLTQQTQRRDNLQYSVILIALLILSGGVISLGFINVSERMAEGIIFFSFLIFFEFLLVLADPYIENWSGGAPGFKLLFNAGIAAMIFPAHAFFEVKLKGRIAKKSG